MSNVHEPNHPEYNFFVGHISEVLNNASVLLPSEPRLVEVLVELVDDFSAVLDEPGRALLLGHLEDTIVEFLPKLDTTSGNLVDGLAKLGANGEDTTSLLRVCTFPLSVVDTLCGNDKILDRRAGVCLFRHHDERGEEETVKGHWLHTEALD